ncbi:MAG: sigma 54-interacting transcriptional regulator [Mangrovibacterium sp.]
MTESELRIQELKMNKVNSNIDHFLHLVIEQLSTAIFAINNEGLLIFQNKVFTDYTGSQNTDEAQYIFSHFPEEEREKISLLINTAIDFGYSETEIESNTNQKRKRRYFMAMNRITHQGVMYGVGELQDISVRSKSEVELQKALSSLHQLTSELERENTYLREEVFENSEFKEVITQNKAMTDILYNIKQVAITDAPIYIIGENGTGKELTSRLIHRLSKRQHKPFVKINCDTILPNMLSQELFGDQEDIPFKKNKIGKLEIANGGTLYLQHINKLSPPLQIRILEALQQDYLAPKREREQKPLDIRIIISSTEPLSKLVETNQFSEELYYRLCIFPMHLPPLRERKEDIPLLINHFTAKYNKKYNYKISKIATRLITKLINYEWPGNISELRSLIERAVLSSKGSRLEFTERLTVEPEITKPGLRFKPWDEHEREYLKRVLEHTTWRIRGNKGAAKLLQLKPTTLESKLKRLGIDKP